MKKILLTIFLLLFCLPAFSSTDYQKAYDALQVPTFSYMFNTDPYQNEDYIKYRFSPYPLLRTGVNFYFKGIVIPKGYYLLTPRQKDGADYVLFKQNGKVVFIIPVYEKGTVIPTFYDRYIKKQEKTPWEKLCDWTNKVVGRVSKDSKRSEPPKAFIEVNDVAGNFWEVVLYYGANKYKLLFLKDN